MSQRKSWALDQDKFITQKVRLNQKVPQKDRLKWGDIADQLNQKFPESGRTGKQCRQRWHNQLDPNISHDTWTVQQQKKLFQLQKRLGNKWAQIAAKLDGRTDNNVKNYFYSTLRKSLRKLNAFILANKNQLKTAKQFKQTSLSKLLAVADHKFDKKINIKNSNGNTQTQAVDIKNLLIEITHVQITESKYKKVFVNLTQKLQEFNKNCKKKKGKRKEDPQQFKHYDQSLNQIDEQMDQDNQGQNQDEESEQEVINKRQKSVRSRSRNKKDSKKQSIQQQSKTKSKAKVQKKQKNKKIEKLQKQKNSQIQKKQSFSLINKNSSSKNNSFLEGSRSFHQYNRSSLDLGKCLQNSGQIYSGSQLFQSFHLGKQEQQKNQIPLKKRNSNKVLRQQSGLSFFNDIPELNMKKNQSKQSLIDDFIEQMNDFDRPKFFQKRSSIRQLPFLNDQMSKLQSNLSFNMFLDNSMKFQQNPQLTKLRSFSKKNQSGANFAAQFQF